MPSLATIEIVPKQHLGPRIKKVNVKADMDFGEGPRPNDIHIFYRPLSAFGGKWIKVAETTYYFGNMPLPYSMQFEKPEEPGTYDVRVIFTLDGERMKNGERTGQFFVD